MQVNGPIKVEGPTEVNLKLNGNQKVFPCSPTMVPLLNVLLQIQLAVLCLELKGVGGRKDESSMGERIEADVHENECS